MIIVSVVIADIGWFVTHDGSYLVLLSRFLFARLAPAAMPCWASWVIVLAYTGGRVLIGSPRSLINCQLAFSVWLQI